MKKIQVVERKLGREKAWGMAYQGEDMIEVDPRQCSREYLDTLIHEALHLISPEWSERKVGAAARRISRLVWAQGFRKCAK